MADNNISVVNSNPQNTTTTFQPFSTIVNIKLDRTNYPLWLAQMLPILKSRDLMRYVDGTLLCPPKHVANSTTVNHAYTAASILSVVTKKGDISMADYLDCMNAIADNLVFAGQPVSDEELVQIVLNNLGPAFEMTVSAAQARDNPIAYPTLESLMLTT
ncbi:uncharacterized protein [Pyrus communis]|uniref:uncharacterized protein n=1 Tax=Pyrus communis TaxID=23211 RepID=UPI0035C12839